jgi:cytochrome P450
MGALPEETGAMNDSLAKRPSIPLAKAPFGLTDGSQRHAAYAELAATAPVHRIMLPTGQQAWLITGYHELRQALHDPRLVTREAAQATLYQKRLSPEVFAGLTSHMVNHDPPEHTRLRRLVTAAFTRRRIEQLTPRIQQITNALLDAMATQTPSDLLASFAYPLPLTVICELLGVPTDDHVQFHRWSTTLTTGALAEPEAYCCAASALVRYLRKLLDIKRDAPADDLLSALLVVRDGEDQLTEDELTSMACLLLIAGHETTANLIGNAVHALLTHPQQWALLQTQPHHLSTAIEEFLRFDGPLQISHLRLSTEPIQIGGTTIPASEIVVPGLLATNRHPACTPQPQVLDLTRADHSHLAFGHGIHHCLGAPLARLEARIALGSLLTRFPRLRLAVPANQLTWRPSMLVNGLTALPVTLY